MRIKTTFIGTITGIAVLIFVAATVFLQGGQHDSVEVSMTEEQDAEVGEDTNEEQDVKDDNKEMKTFKSEEYGFEFHYPKTITLPDGKERQLNIENIDLTKGTTKESVVLRLRSYSMKFSLYVEPTPADFTQLLFYVKELHKQHDETARKEHYNPAHNRMYRQIFIGDQEAVLVEYLVKGHPESSIYIEKDGFLYMMFYQGHLDSSPVEDSEKSRLRILKDLFKSMTFN